MTLEKRRISRMQTPTKNYRSGSATYGTPGKYCAVSWYFHYAKDFLRPYGKATIGINKNVLDQKISAVNFEMLNRPNIALSEFAATIQENMKALQTIEEMSKHVPRFIDRVAKVSKSLDVLNNSSEVESDKRKATDEVLQFFARKSPFMDSYLPSAVDLGAALYSTSLQTAVMRFLAKNPQKVSLN